MYKFLDVLNLNNLGNIFFEPGFYSFLIFMLGMMGLVAFAIVLGFKIKNYKEKGPDQRTDEDETRFKRFVKICIAYLILYAGFCVLLCIGILK